MPSESGYENAVFEYKSIDYKNDAEASAYERAMGGDWIRIWSDGNMGGVHVVYRRKRAEPAHRRGLEPFGTGYRAKG